MSTDDALHDLRDRPRRPPPATRPRRLRRHASDVQRHDRQASGRHRVARDDRGGRRRRPSRSSGRSRHRRARWRPRGRRSLGGRWRPRHRPAPDARRPRRRRRAPSVGPGRRGLGGRRPGDDPARPGCHRRDVLGHRHRRLDARRAGSGFVMGTFGLTCDNVIGADGGHRGRVDRRRRPRRRPRAALGAARWRRQLRRRDGVRVPPPSARADAGGPVHGATSTRRPTALEAIAAFAREAPDEVVIFVVGPT